jgi:N-acetylglucosaminyldiphosphoundecaprenol N-acetyl-beta-D-mannosaminyltransferase
MCRIKIGNIPFNLFSFNEAITTISAQILNGSNCCQVVVANVFSIVLANRDVEFYKICQTAEFVFADGLPIVLFSRLLGKALPQRIAGPDFMWEFSEECSKKGFKVFILGSEEPYLSNLQNNMEKQFPGIKIVGKYSPPFGTWTDQETQKMVHAINKSKADILWLGVSTPKQDKWIYSFKDKLHTKVAIAVGAAFDFHSGRVKRAPVWVQNIGFEWFHRFLQDPKRLWKRYLIGNIRFLIIIFKQIITSRLLEFERKK